MTPQIEQAKKVLEQEDLECCHLLLQPDTMRKEFLLKKVEAIQTALRVLGRLTEDVIGKEVMRILTELEPECNFGMHQPLAECKTKKITTAVLHSLIAEEK